MVQFTIDTEHPVSIPCGDVTLEGLLHLPREFSGVVIFVHGSGSSRMSPRNQYVAHYLQNAKFATLLFDLLTLEEDAIDTQTRQYRFDIEFLTKRLLRVTDWVHANPVLHKHKMGYFGASTGAAAALLAAAQLPDNIHAVVSRGGRPDLAGDQALKTVHAATLLIVGELDEQVIALNQQAYAQMTCTKQMAIVPGASHLFEEPGALTEVAKLATGWFRSLS